MKMAGERADLAPTHQELSAALDPFVSERFAIDDPRWESLLRARTEKVRRSTPRRGPTDALPVPDAEEPSETITRALTWLSRVFRSEPGVVAFQWGQEAIFAKGMGVSRVYLLALMRVIEQLRPATVVEVGFGSAINLFALAGRFPGIRFSGIEINGDAVLRARALQSLGEVPEVVTRFSPETLIDPTAHRRVSLQVGDARLLPFRDASVDLVFTKLALERMKPFQREALGELRRVARRHVVMVEAFREWNDEGLRRDYIATQRYFDYALRDLAGLGLEPIHVIDDLPHKITHRPVLVVTEPRRDATASEVIRG